MSNYKTNNLHIMNFYQGGEIMFCDNFTSLEEALKGLSQDKCKHCPNLVYEDGLLLCKKTEEQLLSQENK